ncbi:MAG: thiamine biosynthesis protein [Desulfobulbus oligotrophicus]|nr:thiamine biosynthesis protein [Desulfobulbus oligotrophicus]
MNKRVALGLFSGGLDSILACRLVAAQGIRVIGLQFVTPFFNEELPARQKEYAGEVYSRYGLEVQLVDMSSDYMHLLDKPVYGFGKHFNPCIDCKIMMLSKARELLPRYGASFLVSGEVIGQRPMSQRRDALRVIERDAGCDGLLLRPLCAQLLPPTRPEIEGIVDRNQLYAFSGRGRKQQRQLAEQLGVTDYPAPAGGCMLTDPNLARRFRQYYSGVFPCGEQRSAEDIRLLTFGRQFKLDKDVWFILGRDERENNRLASLRGTDDWLVSMTSRPGPLGLVRHAQSMLARSAAEREMIPRLAGLVVRFGKKGCDGRESAEVVFDKGDEQELDIFSPVTEEEVNSWRV